MEVSYFGEKFFGDRQELQCGPVMRRFGRWHEGEANETWQEHNELTM
jgi:hypothetical protein